MGLAISLAWIGLLAAAPTAAEPSPFPREVAGFTFGMTPAAFRAACASRGKPSAVEKDGWGMHVRTCDAVEVQPGWRWSVFGAFCAGDTRLCEISYFSTNSEAARDYDILAARLTSQLGRVGKARRTLPDGPADAACAKARGVAGVAWTWGTSVSPEGLVTVILDCGAKPAMLSVIADQADALAAKRAFKASQPARDAGGR